MFKIPIPSFSGFTPVVIATVISGLSGYIAVWIAAQNLVPSMYIDFSVLWSTIFFSIGALSGIQQELSRSTTQTHIDSSKTKKSINFYLFATTTTILIFMISLLVATFERFVVSTHNDPNIFFAITLGLASFVFLSVLLGALYGQQQWKTIAVLVAGEGITRLLLISMALSIPGLSDFLPWAICLPFAIVTLLSAPLWFKKVKSGIALDVNYLKLTRNTLSTIGAASATAVIISGFPLLLKMTSEAYELKQLAPVILLILLVRAPLAVLAQSMQNLLIVKFSGKFAYAIKLFALLSGLVLVLAIFAALVGLVFGPLLIQWVFNNGYDPSGLLVALVLFTSGLLAIQIFTGAFVLARNRHFGYVVGWLFSALLTVVSLLLPLEFEVRVMLALTVGPVVGITANAVTIFISQFIKPANDPTLDLN